MSDFRIQQRAGERLDYALDWRPWLVGSSMVTMSMTVQCRDGWLTLSGEELDGNKTGFAIVGLVAGSVYTVTVAACTSAGSGIVPDRTIEVYISG